MANNMAKSEGIPNEEQGVFAYYSERAVYVVTLAREESLRLGHNALDAEQILLGLIGEKKSRASKIFKSLGANQKVTRIEVEKIIGRSWCGDADNPPPTLRAKRITNFSLSIARSLDRRSLDVENVIVQPEHIALALINDAELFYDASDENVAARVLETLGTSLLEVRNRLMEALGEISNRQNKRSSKTPTLDQYGTNLTIKAQQGRIDPVVGRDEEIERVIQILGRRSKNNAVLVGEAGTGKTSIAEGLAKRIVDRDIPETLYEKTVMTLEMGQLVSGTRYRGDFEERLTSIMDEVRAAKNVILVIDEMHTLVGAGGSEGALDAANLLKPALARGELQCIGATTISEYTKYIEPDPALERRFHVVKVEEPSVDETVEILFGLRDRYEEHHKVTISDEALTAAANLADQYIADRFLPDKAIDLLDEAGSRVRLMNSRLPETKKLEQELKSILRSKDTAKRKKNFEQMEKLYERELEVKSSIRAIAEKVKDDEEISIVTEEDIAEVVAAWTSIPINKLTESEAEMLLQMEATLHERVIGQDEAVEAVSRAIRRARAGLKNPNRPIASLLFSGPTGVGKTEICKALASYFFGSEEAMVRIDMSEYAEKHSVSKLIGTPPGYVGYEQGGQLTDAVRRRPSTIVLFDEVEKAHPEVYNIFLQLFDDGRLSDTKGRVVNFKNTLIIMTSNIGSKEIQKGSSSFGFERSAQGKVIPYYKRLQALVNEELKKHFLPEILNRLDEIIVFRQLKRHEVGEIAEIMLKEIKERVSLAIGIELKVTERFKTKLLEEGYNPLYGARPLRRAVTRLLEDPLSEKFLTVKPADGDIAIADIDNSDEVIILLVDKEGRKK